MTPIQATKTKPSDTSSEGEHNYDSPQTILKGAETKLATLLAETQRLAKEVAYIIEPQRERRDIAKDVRWFMVTDAIAFFCAFIGSWMLARMVNIIILHRSFVDMWAGGDSGHLGQFIAIALGAMLWFEHTEHYRTRMPFWLELKKIIGTLSFAMMIDGFLLFAAKQDFSRLWLMFGWIIAGIGIVTFRSVYRSLRYKQGTWHIPSLLIGGGSTAEDARMALQSEPSLGYEIRAQIKDLPQAFAQAGESWEALCARHKADYIVVAMDGPEMTRAELPIAQLMRESVPFSVCPPMRHVPVLGMVPHYFFNHDVMLMTRSSDLEQPLPRLIKRSFDVFVSGLALLVTSPLILFLATMVKLDGGPALFGQARIGMNGKLFKCLKFRSMVMGADEALERYLAQNPEALAEYNKFHKLKRDPRVTRFGEWMRKTSLDELPQLINVLKGDMSLVGPRPILTTEAGHYSQDIAHYYRVRPGITGLWQVSGRNKITFSKRVQMESWYVRNWTLWHDIAILCKTVPVIFKRHGAY